MANTRWRRSRDCQPRRPRTPPMASAARRGRIRTGRATSRSSTISIASRTRETVSSTSACMALRERSTSGGPCSRTESSADSIDFRQPVEVSVEADDLGHQLIVVCGGVGGGAIRSMDGRELALGAAGRAPTMRLALHLPVPLAYGKAPLHRVFGFSYSISRVGKFGPRVWPAATSPNARASPSLTPCSTWTTTEV